MRSLWLNCSFQDDEFVHETVEQIRVLKLVEGNVRPRPSSSIEISRTRTRDEGRGRGGSGEFQRSTSCNSAAEERRA